MACGRSKNFTHRWESQSIYSGHITSEGVLGSPALRGYQEPTQPPTVPNGRGPPTRTTAMDHSGLLLLRDQTKRLHRERRQRP